MHLNLKATKRSLILGSVTSLIFFFLSCQQQDGASLKVATERPVDETLEICVLPEDVTLENIQEDGLREDARTDTSSESQASNQSAAREWMRLGASSDTPCSAEDSQKTREWVELTSQAQSASQGMALAGAGGQGLCAESAGGHRMVGYMRGSTGIILHQVTGSRTKRFSFSGTSPDVLCARMRLMFGEV